MHYKHQPELDIKQFSDLRSPLRFDIFPLKQNSVILVSSLSDVKLLI
jgi:hypothetical protein